MGIVIINKEADYSGLGLGKISMPDFTNYEEEALTFFERLSISDKLTKKSINTAVKQLKYSDLYNKIDKLYFFAGDNYNSVLADFKNNSTGLVQVGNPIIDNGVQLSSNKYIKTDSKSNTVGHALISIKDESESIRVLLGTQNFYNSPVPSGVLLYPTDGVNLKYWQIEPDLQANCSGKVKKGTILINIGASLGNYLFNNDNLIGHNTNPLQPNPLAISNKWCLGAWLDYAVDPTNTNPQNPLYSTDKLGCATFGSLLSKIECITLSEIMNRYLISMGRI